MTLRRLLTLGLICVGFRSCGGFTFNFARFGWLCCCWSCSGGTGGAFSEMDFFLRLKNDECDFFSVWVGADELELGGASCVDGLELDFICEAICWAFPCVAGRLRFVIGMLGNGGGDGGLRFSSLALSEPNHRRKKPGRSLGGFCGSGGRCCLRGPPTVGLGAAPVAA